MDLQPLSLHPDPERLQKAGCQCQHGMTEHGTMFVVFVAPRIQNGTAQHSMALHTATGSGRLSRAGGAN